ncbi:hypothetical protein [Bosea sp. RAC05]|uniref:hypothetical protein n=1 Tax=Bosea sp. RAC05 TaxID=1842539 RepID=UPI00083D12CC|nr:hypothetical protein [Bosea sp. RAC05]AOG03109.1 hypothetical protein BSY19_4940 [Bosea sp. RAC05]
MTGQTATLTGREGGYGLIAIMRRCVRVASFAFNLVLAFAAILIAWRLWGMAQTWMINAGGWPYPSFEYARQIAYAPGLKERVIWWSMAWAAYVFAGGFVLISLAGVRSLIWRIHGALRALA